jgi:hypothetical protein
MRRLFASLPFLLLAGCVSHPKAPAELHFERVWLAWHDADSFQSYYEYRTGDELVGKWTVLRSEPYDRTGLYFEIRTENPAAPRNAKIAIRVISPDSIDPRVFTFPVEVPAGGRLFVVGITGTDWPFQRVVPVAWDVELQAPDGAVLAKKVSFLWEKPGR